LGWRGACLVYAGLHLVVALPLQMAVMPPLSSVSSGAADAGPPDSAQHNVLPPAHERLIFLLLALVLTISAGVGSIMVVHLLIFLQARGAEFALAVTLGTLFGPAQVGARFVERVFGARYHPIWTMIASCVLMAMGLGLLLGGFPILLLTIVLYGAGYGIMWIARGTLPLALFGPKRYATLIGRLAFPSLIVQALAPSAGALLVESHGVDVTLAVLTGLALANVVLIGILLALCRRSGTTA
jgi:MFS family permease